MQLGATDISDAVEKAYNLEDFQKRISQIEKTNRMQTMALIAIVIYLFTKYKDAKS